MHFLFCDKRLVAQLVEFDGLICGHGLAAECQADFGCDLAHAVFENADPVVLAAHQKLDPIQPLLHLIKSPMHPVKLLGDRLRQSFDELREMVYFLVNRLLGHMSLVVSNNDA